MVGKFRLVGLERSGNGKYLTATLLVNSGRDTFKAPVAMEEDRQQALWEYCKDNWDGKKLAHVKHNGITTTGVPLVPVVTNIEDL